ncbi:DMT family transporter [Roseovarius arcticus]|uniref:DMT family transporter n=1 Tax=Roseovarius arcticus TaxID=2547404 RepID=UPI0011103E92|nr:SMR family transporter [Roseovarius arcticus]
MLFYWCVLLIAVCANVFANVAFKSAMRDIPAPLDLGAISTLFVAPWMWAGMASAVLLLTCFLIAIRGIDLSVAYPAITGLAMVGIILAGNFLFAEALSLQKLAGVGFVIVGIIILSQVKQI